MVPPVMQEEVCMYVLMEAGIGGGGRAFRYNFAVTLFTCTYMHLTGGERVGIRPG